MRILAFGDTHGDMLSLQTAKQKAHQAELAICLGDLTWFGEDLEPLTAFLDTFPCKVLIIHGNHEMEKAMRVVCERLANVMYLHGQHHMHKDFNFLAYGGDGFSRRDPLFEAFTKEHAHLDMTCTVLLTHGPPHDTKLDLPYGEYHSGSHSYREFIERHQPLLALSGHVHECEKQMDTVELTIVFNPGPDGELIDLAALQRARP